MRWRKGRRSSNVEDRRGRAPRLGGGLPRGMRLPVGVGRKSGCTTIIMILLVLYVVKNGGLSLEGGDIVSDIFSTQQSNYESTQQAPTQHKSVRVPANDALADFVSVVLADTEDTWHTLFQGIDQRYSEPTLVLFSRYVRSACGMAQSASGPFYCPADQKLYIDLDFYRQLKQQHNAPGDFAQAYVIAHEVGHHVQTLLGISQQVQVAQRRVSKLESNKLLVRLELQADCFSGLWANHAQQARQILEPGDIEEALNAASQIGDDTLQRQTQGYVVPESFTHGTSAQRSYWFRRGFERGDLSACDTFNAQTI